MKPHSSTFVFSTSQISEFDIYFVFYVLWIVCTIALNVKVYVSDKKKDLV